MITVIGTWYHLKCVVKHSGTILSIEQAKNIRALLFCVLHVHSVRGMQEWVIQIPSIPILVSVLFPSLHLRIHFLLLVHIRRRNTLKVATE